MSTRMWASAQRDGRPAKEVVPSVQRRSSPYYEDIWSRHCCLWSPYVIGQTIIFLPCGYYLSIFFFSSPNLSGRRLDVYHTSTHGVALVRI